MRRRKAARGTGCVMISRKDPHQPYYSNDIRIGQGSRPRRPARSVPAWDENAWKDVRDVKEKLKKWAKPVLFTAGGALAGLGYYNFVGCASGACPLTSHPLVTMAYMGLVGWLASGLCGKGCGGKCSM